MKTSLFHWAGFYSSQSVTWHQFFHAKIFKAAKTLVSSFSTRSWRPEWSKRQLPSFLVDERTTVFEYEHVDIASFAVLPSNNFCFYHFIQWNWPFAVCQAPCERSISYRFCFSPTAAAQFWGFSSACFEWTLKPTTGLLFESALWIQICSEFLSEALTHWVTSKNFLSIRIGPKREKFWKPKKILYTKVTFKSCHLGAQPASVSVTLLIYPAQAHCTEKKEAELKNDSRGDSVRDR